MNKGKTFPPEVLTADEVKSILATFAPSNTGARNRALVAVYFYAQLRCNEALDLRPCDIDWDSGAITVLRGKGGKRRVSGISVDHLLAHADGWRRKRPDSPHFFCTLRGDRMDDSYVRRMIKRHALKAGLERRVHVHGFRHSGAFHLANQGMDLRLISQQLGHSNLSTTERYINHLCPRAAVEAVNSVSW